MNNKFYSFREKIILLLLLLISVGSLFFFFQFKTFAFPEYNIAFSIDRNQAAEKAKTFLSEMKVSDEGYRDVTVFTVDEEAKTYLERKLDISQTEIIAENNIDLWHFTTRVFKPLNKEEYRVSFLPNGRLSGFSRTVAEDKPGASLPSNDAQIIAGQFLTQHTSTNLSAWQLVDVTTTNKKQRIDHKFIWEQKKFSLHDATYRKEVSVIGGQIGGYREYLKVPENWQRQYENERSQNDLAQTIAEVISFLLFGISTVIFFIVQYRKNNLRLRMGYYVALTTFVIVVLATVNSLPLVIFTYETTESWESFIGQVILGAIVTGGMLGFLNLFIVSVGECLYRQLRPGHIALEKIFGKGIFTKQINKSLLVGSFAGIISFGYVVLFYITGRNFNFWSPAEINYNDAFSTYIPWIYPLFIGFTAAVFEEGIFRLFGIPFLIKYVKKPWVAVVITAFVWGFLHSNYPQSPWFARGIEVGIEGLLLGFLFLRYGILASVVSHYTFNALITSVALASSANPINSFVSFFFALLPLLIGIVFLVRAMLKKGFITQVSSLTNQHIETLTKKIIPSILQSIEQTAARYQIIVSKRFVVVISMLALVSLGGIFLLAPDINVAMQANTITRDEALSLAKKALQTKTAQPNGYTAVVQYVPSLPDALEQEYILKNADFTTIQNIYAEDIPTALWSIRFFKPLIKEEYSIFLLPTGEVYSIDHLLAEDAKGENLAKKEALQLAENYLQRQQHEDISNYTLVASEVEKKKNRTDHYFSFENKTEQIKDARLRADVQIIGNEPSGFEEYIKLPESWIRDKQERTAFDFIFMLILLLPIVFFSVYGIATFFGLVKNKLLHFKQALLFAIPFASVSVLQLCNELPFFYTSYQTTIPLETYVIEQVLGIAVEQIIGFLFASLIIAMFWALWKKYFGTVLPRERKDRLLYLRDALFIGYTLPFLLAGYGITIAYISLEYKLLPAFAFPEELTGIDTLLPALTVVDSFASAVLAFFTCTILLLVMYKKVKSPLKVAGIILLFLLVVEAKELVTSPSEIPTVLLQLVITLLSFALLVFVVLRVIKTNILAYLCIVYVCLIMANAWDLWSQENIFFQLNGYLLFALVVLPLLVYFLLTRKKI